MVDACYLGFCGPLRIISMDTKGQRQAAKLYLNSSPTSLFATKLLDSTGNDKLLAPMYNLILDIHAPLEFTYSLPM